MMTCISGRFFSRSWPHMATAARGTFATLTSLSIAVLLQLECPFWAAMTALIVIQPTCGLLLEKSFYRLTGTAMGSMAGLAILLTANSPAMVTILLSLWLAGCVGTGSLLYGLRSYGALVAGCTGAVIAMAGYDNTPHLYSLAFGRIACIAIGISVSTAVTFFFTHRRSKLELLDRLRRAAASDLEWLALVLRGSKKAGLSMRRQDILMEIADIEAAMDAAWAGNIDLKRRKRRIRSLIVSLLSLMEAGKLAGIFLDTMESRHPGQSSWREPLALHLEEIASSLNVPASTGPDAAALQKVLTEAAAHLPLLASALDELVRALRLLTTEWDHGTENTARGAANPFILHRDWQEAGRAALRAASAISTVGAIWHLTGWGGSPQMIMAASIMVSIFSTQDRPAEMLANVFIGASCGVAAAFLCRLFILPGITDPVLQIAICIPFLMSGIMALSHRRTAPGAMDAMLFFLFITQPGIASMPAAPDYVAGGLAALGGIAVAVLFFHYLLPIDPARRLRSILIAIVNDLGLMASAVSGTLEAKCRARTHHRVLRMVANAGKLADNTATFVNGGLATLTIARCLCRLKDTERSCGISLEASGVIRDTMINLAGAARNPEEILPLLEEISSRLCIATDVHPWPYSPSILTVSTKTPDANGFPPELFLPGAEIIHENA